MPLTSAAQLTSDLLRLSYQTVEAVSQNRPPQTIAERITQVMKDHIALLDVAFTIGEYATDLSLNIWIIPFRVGVIVEGIYRLQSDPNADARELTNDIVINVLNISRVAFSRFNQTAAQFLLGADVAYRLSTLFFNRTALMDRIREITYYGILDILIRTGDLLVAAGDYLARAAVASLFIGLAYFRGSEILKTFIELPTQTRNEIVGWTATTCLMSLFISEAVRKIFDDLGWQPSTKRQVVAISLSSIGCAALMGAVAVGLGRAASMSAIFKPISQGVAVATLAATIGYLFKTAASQFSDALDIPTGFLRGFEEWSFTIISSATLTAIASAGFGITPSIADSALTMLQITSVALAALLMGCSIIAASATACLGVPSWAELGDWSSYFG